MFGLLPVIEVLFTNLLAPRAILSLGKALGVLSLGAEVYLHKENARVGRNPVIRDEVNKNVEKWEAELGKSVKTVFNEPHTEAYEFFQLKEGDVDDPRIKHTARSWLLTSAEKVHLSDLIKRNAFSRFRDKEEHELQKLMLFSDNRLVRAAFVEPIRMSIKAAAKLPGADLQSIEDALRHLREAVGEARARKNQAA